MNKEHHIQDLIYKIKHIIKEPIKGWVGKISKSCKIRKIKKKIQSLRKEK